MLYIEELSPKTSADIDNVCDAAENVDGVDARITSG
jgi:hypothetical protein